MSGRSVRMTVADTLSDLSKSNFENFVYELLDRREEPRIRRNRVEGKSYLEVTDVLVSTFTEAGAPRVVAELLRQIGCNEEADSFGERPLDTLKCHTPCIGYRMIMCIIYHHAVESSNSFIISLISDCTLIFVQTGMGT